MFYAAVDAQQGQVILEEPFAPNDRDTILLEVANGVEDAVVCLTLDQLANLRFAVDEAIIELANAGGAGE